MKKTVIDILKDKLITEEKNKSLINIRQYCIDWYDLSSIVNNWPEVKEDYDESDKVEDYVKSSDSTGYYEQLDLENYGVISLTKDELVFCGGGDWQIPLTMKIVSDGENLYINNIEIGYSEGMDEDKVIEILTK